MIYLLAPEIVVITTGLLILITDLCLPKRWSLNHPKGKYYLVYLGITGLSLAFVLCTQLFGVNLTIFKDMLHIDSVAIFFKSVLLIAGLLILLISADFFKGSEYEAEYYTLLLFSISGAMFMASANDFITVYLALELTSIPTYVLVGLQRKEPKSAEAAIKYALLGILGSVLIIYGISLLYGLTGTTNLARILSRLRNYPIELAHATKFAPVVSMLFIGSGLSLKIAAAPFHFRAPDAYEGAPTPVTAYLSVEPKCGTFALMVRLFLTTFSVYQSQWVSFFIFLSLCSMFVGNLMALTQKNIKRMLAYSSIAHTGYIFIGFAVAKSLSLSAMLFYVIVYVLANIGAFAVVIANSRRGKGESIESFAGLGQTMPYLSLAMTIFLLSLAGIPPLAGFMGKLNLFLAAVIGGYTWLVLIAVLNSAVSLYYYLGVVRQMYLPGLTLSQEFGLNPIQNSKLLHVAITILVIAIISIGIYPTPFIRLAQTAINTFFF